MYKTYQNDVYDSEPCATEFETKADSKLALISCCSVIPSCPLQISFKFTKLFPTDSIFPLSLISDFRPIIPERLYPPVREVSTKVIEYLNDATVEISYPKVSDFIISHPIKRY